MFIISGTNDKLWNFQELVEYLAKNQHRCISLKINPEAICLESLGIYRLLDNFEFEQVDIYTQNQLETHDKYNIIVDKTNEFLRRRVTIDPGLHSWNHEKVFLAMYYRPSANRLGLASYLNANYPDQSLLHFSCSTDIDSTQLFEFEKVAHYDLQSLANIGDLLPKLPMRVFSGNLDLLKKFIYQYNENGGIQIYNKILIDIVSESHVAGVTFYPTEKTARPIWLKKPFIIFGSRDYLDYLHQMGFQTFCNFWSEEYDGYEGRDRYLRILSLIDDLAKKSKEELQELYQAMQPILDHNYNLLKTQSYNPTVTRII